MTKYEERRSKENEKKEDKEDKINLEKYGEIYGR